MSETPISPLQLHNAVRNEHHASFTLGDREFAIKDLDFDSYIEFVSLAKPIIELVSGTLDLTGSPDAMQTSLNPEKLDVDAIIKVAGHNLPRLCWLCCKQSDPKITLNEVKRLARRPFPMIEVVMLQVKHNGFLSELTSFFASMGTMMTDLMPDVKTATQPVPVGAESATTIE